MKKRSTYFNYSISAAILIWGIHTIASEQNYQITSGQVEFSTKAKAGVLKVSGKGAQPKGSVQLAGSKAKGVILIDLNEFTTGIGLRDEHMKNKYLETKKYPEARLELTEVNLEKEKFSGQLELHGVKKEIEGKLVSKLSEDSADAQAQFSLNLKDFQVATPSFMEVELLDKVDVQVQLNLNKQKDPI